MKTIIFRPILFLVMILSVAFVSINAGQAIEDGRVKIEISPGFTIEDIIQDLHDNSNINVDVTQVTDSIYVLNYNTKKIDKSSIEQFFDNHSGANIVDLR